MANGLAQDERVKAACPELDEGAKGYNIKSFNCILSALGLLFTWASNNSAVAMASLSALCPW